MRKTTLALIAAGLIATFYDPKPETLIDIKQGSGTIYEQTQEEGELELRVVAQYRQMEDCWAYHDNKWYDVGYNEKSTNVELDNYMMMIPLFEIQLNNKKDASISFYHVHPSFSTGCLKVGTYLSELDIYMHYALKKYFNNQNVGLVSCVINKDEVIEYDFTPELYRQFLISGEKGLRRLQPAFAMLEVDSKDWRYGLKQCTDRYYKNLSDCGMIIKRRPFDNRK